MVYHPVLRKLNVSTSPVPDVVAAVRWYERALGARREWGPGDHGCGLAVEWNYFSVGPPITAGASARVDVIVADVDGFVGRAEAAGADSAGTPVLDHTAPWGRQRRGGFLDPFGVRWVVSDKSPLTWHGPGRAHHLGYIEAVADALVALDIASGRVIDLSTDVLIGQVEAVEGEEPKRAAAVPLAGDIRGWQQRWRHAESTVLEWDEEFGWTMEVREDTSHGFTCVRYSLGLDLVADPEVSALTVETVLRGNGREPEYNPSRRRRATHRDLTFEWDLAAYLPT